MSSAHSRLAGDPGEAGEVDGHRLECGVRAPVLPGHDPRLDQLKAIEEAHEHGGAAHVVGDRADLQAGVPGTGPVLWFLPRKDALEQCS